MINCIVVDDQIESTELMIAHISKIPLLSLKFSSTNPIEALAFLDKEKVDCVFLDIEMPQLTGLEFIETLKSKLGNSIPKIVLITGYDQYALSGYDYGVFDYLLKPISFKRFKISMDRLIETLNASVEARDFFFADIDGKKIKITLSKIIYIEGAGNYIYIVTNEAKMICYKTMSSLLDILPKDKFIRVHKSFIISLGSIQFVRGNEIFVNLNSIQKNIPIGITYKVALLKILGITE